jgi:hypothetical protein
MCPADSHICDPFHAPLLQQIFVRQHGDYGVITTLGNPVNLSTVFARLSGGQYIYQCTIYCSMDTSTDKKST